MALKPVQYVLLGLIITVFSLPVYASNGQGLPDFTGLIEEHSPAVVKIETITRVKSRQQPNVQIPDNVPDIFRHFFEHRQMPERNGRSMGSGFFISEDGYILTNNHVVEGATDITVRLIDRREFNAEIIGLDPQSDLALLKISATKLPYLSLADSDQTRVGEWVLAIGSPFGLDYSVSAGIVSAIGRSIPSSQQQNYVPFIQTDVAINPGNSGGPLFNLKGDVVGINSQIYTNSGGSIGLSFAIPANLAKNVVAQLKENGRVERGWLGVVIQDVGKDLALSFGLDKPQGALIAQIDTTGPAKKSGLQIGDIILTFNGKEIKTSSDLPHAVGPIKPGTKVPARVMRKGKEVKLNVKVGTRSKASLASSETPSSQSRLGVTVEALSQDIRDSVGVDGVVITSVDSDSPAAKSGLAVGDLIVQLGFESVSSIKALRRIEKALSANKPHPIRVIRQGRPLFRSIILEK